MADEHKGGTGDTNPDPAKAAADKAAADTAKAAADKLAADNVAAGKNPDGTAKDSGKPDGDNKPVVPEKYELALPDGSSYTAADLADLSAEAKTLGLTQEQAQARLDIDLGRIQERRKLDYEAIVADPQLGGANLESSLTLIKTARDKVLAVLPEGNRTALIARLTRAGLDNDPDLARVFANLGKMLKEDDPIHGRRDDKGDKKTDAAAVLYGGEKS